MLIIVHHIYKGTASVVCGLTDPHYFLQTCSIYSESMWFKMRRWKVNVDSCHVK